VSDTTKTSTKPYVHHQPGTRPYTSSRMTNTEDSTITCQRHSTSHHQETTKRVIPIRTFCSIDLVSVFLLCLSLHGYLRALYAIYLSSISLAFLSRFSLFFPPRFFPPRLTFSLETSYPDKNFLFDRLDVRILLCLSLHGYLRALYAIYLSLAFLSLFPLFFPRFFPRL
jgi:hypothetical protein